MEKISNNIMNNLGKHIIETQNTETGIKEISAQKQLYSIAKDLFYVQCFIATIIPIALSFTQLLFPNQSTKILWVFVFYSISASITEIILDRIVIKLKEKAASIQESFDCAVLNVQWNSILIPDKPLPETIYRWYSKYIKTNSTNNLYNWYSTEIEKVDTNLATVICQRTNCVYDFSIRKKYSVGLGLLTVFTFGILFFLATTTGLSLQKLLTHVIFPSFPIFVLSVKQYFLNRDSIKNLGDLKSLIGSTLSKVSLQTTINQNTIRQIQDKIYNNRILSPLLPDWVFNKFRDRLEAEMHFAVKDIIEKIKSN